MPNADAIVDYLLAIHSFDRVPRAGFLLRGVTEVESVAAHSHALALLAALVCGSREDEGSRLHMKARAAAEEEARDRTEAPRGSAGESAPLSAFDREKAVLMALVHDIPEIATMDIPLPAGTESFKRAKVATEMEIFASLCNGDFGDIEAVYAEYVAGETPEARLVKGLDKVQMMVKVLGYEREGRGRLEDFWNNSANFNTYGIGMVEALFQEIAKRAGRVLPTDSATRL